MKQFLMKQIEYVTSLSIRERNALLCELLVKEQLGILDIDEMLQLSIIQAIRLANGEIDRVLKKLGKTS